MNYILGLDLGIASVGWAVLDQDAPAIVAIGVRAFDAAENPQDKHPLAEPRRLARSARRRTERRAKRLRDLKDMFAAEGLVSSDRKDTAFLCASDTLTPWQLRAEGLDRLLEPEELARALFHIARRRGYQSNSRSQPVAAQEQEEGKAKENKKVESGIQSNRQRMLSGNYRTAGEMIQQDPEFAFRKRNAHEEYTHSIGRAALREEVVFLFSAQRRLGNPIVSNALEEKFLAIFSRQLPFASGDLILSKVGACTLDEREKRAPRAAYTSERFALLQNINHISWYAAGEECRPSSVQRAVILQAAYDRCDLSYSQVRKLLNLSDDARFKAVNYHQKKIRTSKTVAQPALQPGSDSTADPKASIAGTNPVEPEKKKRFCKLIGYQALRGWANQASTWDDLVHRAQMLDDLAFALTFYKNEDEVQDFLLKHGVPVEVAQLPNKPEFRGVMNLSLKAMRKLIPYLEEGEVYSEACRLAGYNHSQPGEGAMRHKKLPPVDHDKIRNPIVFRTLCQARKVVNAVVEKYGSPTRIHIELAREMGKTPAERKEIEKRNDENGAERERKDRQFQEVFGRLPKNGEERLKWRLCKEQGDQCAYSQHELDMRRIFEDGYVEIDHIIPYSACYDDSMSNKVLVLSAENQNKGAQTPYQYFGNDDARWSHFEAWTNSVVHDFKKSNKLLSKTIPELELEDSWLPRNLVDTQYISREFSGILRENLLFADPSVKVPVVSVKGFMTSMLRAKWGLEKLRTDDRHHAVDAAVIAAINPRLIQRVTRYRQLRDGRKWVNDAEYVDAQTGEVIKYKFDFPRPWESFRNDIEKLKADINVSRPPDKGVSGQMHDATIHSARVESQDGRIIRWSKWDEKHPPSANLRIGVTRKPLQKLTAPDLPYLFAPETNAKLYEAIRVRMEQFGMEGKNAFAQPLHKPTNDGSPGPIVRSVKIAKSKPSGIPIRGGIAANGDMARIDVFQKTNKQGKINYFIVPVYVADFLRGVLPNRAITAHKPEESWTPIDGSYQFLFSLHSSDLVKVKSDKGDQFIGYYRGCDRDNGKIAIAEINSSANKPRFSTKNALLVEKYQMGILGDYHKVKKEKRLGMADGRNIEPGEAEG